MLQTIFLAPGLFMNRQRILTTAKVYGHIYHLLLTSPGVLASVFVTRIVWLAYSYWALGLMIVLIIRLVVSIINAYEESESDCHFSLFSFFPPLLVCFSLFWGVTTVGSFEEAITTHVTVARLTAKSARRGWCTGCHTLRALWSCSTIHLSTIVLCALVYCFVRAKMFLFLLFNFQGVIRAFLARPQKLHTATSKASSQKKVPLQESAEEEPKPPESPGCFTAIGSAMTRLAELFSFNYYTLPFSIANGCSYRGGQALANSNFSNLHFLDDTVYQTCTQLILFNLSMSLFCHLVGISGVAAICIAVIYIVTRFILTCAATSYQAIQVAASSGMAADYFEELEKDFEAGTK